MVQLTPRSLDEDAINAKIETEGLQWKFDDQLVKMRASHLAKSTRYDDQIDEVTNFPDSVRFRLKQDGLSALEIETELTETQNRLTNKKARLLEVVDLITSEQGLRRGNKVKRDPVGTTFFIDADNGGDLEGIILFCEAVLDEIGADTIVIPGHGPVAKYQDLVDYVVMLKTIRDRIAALIAEGATLDEIVAAKPTAEWDAVKGDPARLLDRVYASMGN